MIQFQSSYFSFLCKSKIVLSSQKYPFVGNRGDRQPSYHPSGSTQATRPPPRGDAPYDGSGRWQGTSGSPLQDEGCGRPLAGVWRCLRPAQTTLELHSLPRETLPTPFSCFLLLLSTIVDQHAWQSINSPCLPLLLFYKHLPTLLPTPRNLLLM